MMAIHTYCGTCGSAPKKLKRNKPTLSKTLLNWAPVERALKLLENFLRIWSLLPKQD